MKKIIFPIIFLFPFVLCAQLHINARIEYGYSKPWQLEKSLFANKEAFEGQGLFSKGFFLGFNKKKDRHQLEYSTGLRSLGYEQRAYTANSWIFTNRYYDNNGTLVKKEERKNTTTYQIRTSIYESFYWNNSLTYRYSFVDKISATFSVHYLQNLFSNMVEIDDYVDASLTNTTWLQDRIYYELYRKEDRFLMDMNHFSISGGLSYPLGNRTTIGFDYMIGLGKLDKDFNKLRDTPKRTQNFSIFISRNLWKLGKTKKVRK